MALIPVHCAVTEDLSSLTLDTILGHHKASGSGIILATNKPIRSKLVAFTKSLTTDHYWPLATLGRCGSHRYATIYIQEDELEAFMRENSIPRR